MRASVAALGAVLLLLVAVPAQSGAQSTASADRGLSNALSQDLRDIGGATGAYVVDLNTSQVLYSSGATVPRLPASVEKLYTTSTALLRFGPRATLTTSIFGLGTRGRTGTWNGTLFLRGGGDPTFGSAGFDHYAYGTGATMQRLVSTLLHHTGIKAIKGRIVGDESYFDSLRGTSESGFRFDPYMEGSLSALAYNRGLTDGGASYVVHPAIFAADQLSSVLRDDHVRVPRGTSIFATRTPKSARLLATVSSPKMQKLIALTNTPSDNFFAEMLLKGIGARFGGRGSTAAGAAVVRAEVASKFGIHPTLVDGSGLSRADHTSPRQVVTVLKDMAGDPQFVNSLAVGGETGTLADLMRGTPAQGRCHGKTGTLSDVANLAGLCRADDGHMLAFAFLANSIGDTDYVHAVEANDMAVAVARYDG